jgi:transposase
MRDTFLKQITDDQRNILYAMIEGDDVESSYRAKIILLKYKGYTVPEIRMATNHHDVNIRKWIHRFNEKGIEGIISRKHIHKPIKIFDDIEKKIVER